MAQIIKHRRGSIGSLKSTTARNAELIIASGSISDLSGPFVFIGSPNSGDEGIAGAFNTVSKLYTGTNAPTITAATYGSGLDGTPYYASGDKSLYILNNSNVGNTKIDLTGNIEGNTISGVTINNITGTTAYIANMSGSFTGSGEGLYNIPATGITGLNLSKIYSGSVQVTTDSVSGDIHIDADNGVYVSGTTLDVKADMSLTGSFNLNDSAANFSIVGNGFSQTYFQGNGALVLNPGYGGVEVVGNDSHLKVNDYVTVGNSVYVTGSVYSTKIEGTGSLYLQPDQGDSRFFEIYNTGNNDIHFKGNATYAFFGGDTNYLKLDDGAGYTTLVGDNNVYISSNVGNVSISSYDGSSLELNTDGGEGNINLGNYNNALYGHITVADFAASNYAQLTTSGSYVWTEDIGAHLHNDSGSAGVGFTARQNGIIEATGSLYVYGDTQISGNTSVTGSLVVTDGAAFINQGVVSENSNVLLTSGSNLIVENNGSAWVDYIRGNSQEWNYLALNSNGVFSPSGVELASSGNISLWAEGGTVNVTGSMRVTGDIIFSGSINLGDYSGDTVNFNGEISSSIIPQTNNAFDLGSADNYWRDLYVSGTAHIGILNANTISLDGITVFEDLVVSGSSYLGMGGGDQVIVSGSMYLDSLTQGRFAIVGAAGQITDNGNFNYDGSQVGISGSIKLNDTAYLYNDGPLFLEDTTNGVQINGGNSNYLELNSNGYAKLYGTNGVDIEATNGNLWLWSDYNDVWIGSYDGSSLNLNHDGGEGNVNIGNGDNNLNIYSNTYFNNGKTLFVNKMWDNADTSNYLELYGYGTDDGYWWESGSGADTTLNNNWGGANTNILNTNSGNVNIDATNGSVNLHSNNGFNVTGSMIVSDGSGVFNSSLIVSNSDLTLDGGTNQHMNDGAHLYFDTCVDMYYDGGEGNFVFYNDCNNFQFRNNVSITGSINVTNGINTDNIYGVTTYFNALHLNNGTYNAPDVELTSYGDISLFSEGNRSRPSTINMTGSVHITGDLDVTGSVYAGGMFNYNNDINDGGIYIDAGNYTEISYNDEEVYLGVDGGGIWGTSNTGQNQLTSNGGDTTINANNGYNVNINANDLLLNANTAVTGALSVSADTSLLGNLYVSGNLEVLGSSTNVNLESHTVNIGDNIILVNAYSPFQRYAGLAAFDSGSSGVSGSLLWDSLNDYWMFVSASGQSSKLIGTTAGTYGSENNLTSGTIPIATGNNNIGDSLLTYTGTTLAYNTNKFTIDSGTGETYINGNVTLNSGASDLGSKTSGIVFRNDDDVLGFVSTTETTDVMDGVLGYRSSDGVLVFSTVIDGGSY